MILVTLFKHAHSLAPTQMHSKHLYMIFIFHLMAFAFSLLCCCHCCCSLKCTYIHNVKKFSGIFPRIALEIWRMARYFIICQYFYFSQTQLISQRILYLIVEKCSLWNACMFVCVCVYAAKPCKLINWRKDSIKRKMSEFKPKYIQSTVQCMYMLSFSRFKSHLQMRLHLKVENAARKPTLISVFVYVCLFILPGTDFKE